MRQILLLSLLLFLFVTLPVSADITVSTCPHENGAYFQRGVFAKYDYKADLFALYSAQSGAVVTPVEALDARYFNILKWSPDCHYLLATVDDDMVIWDMQAHSRIHQATIPRTRDGLVTWDATGDYVVIVYSFPSYPPPDRVDTAYLWHLPDNRVSTLHAPCMPQRWEFDYARRTLLGVGVCSFYYTDTALTAFSLDSGEQVGYYESGRRNDIGSCYDDFAYRLFNNMRFVLAHCSHGNVRLYDRDAGQFYIIDSSILEPASYALSPDGRYLAAGWANLHVWDLTQASPENHTVPQVQFDASWFTMSSLQFVDERTVKVVGFFNHGYVQCWNVVTGAEAPCP